MLYFYSRQTAKGITIKVHYVHCNNKQTPIDQMYVNVLYHTYFKLKWLTKVDKGHNRQTSIALSIVLV